MSNTILLKMDLAQPFRWASWPKPTNMSQNHRRKNEDQEGKMFEFTHDHQELIKKPRN
jgi:hypothetical protein